jgi:hypothetical protein
MGKFRDEKAGPNGIKDWLPPTFRIALVAVLTDERYLEEFLAGWSCALELAR